MLCTPTYRRRCEGREDTGVGNGASFEGLLLLQHLYDHGGKNHGRKLIPVYYPADVPDPIEAIPPPLRPLSRYALEREYDAISSGSPRSPRPPSGSPRSALLASTRSR